MENQNSEAPRELTQSRRDHEPSRGRALFCNRADWEFLKQRCLPSLLQGGGTLRAWVAGCASGEEVYSLAICLAELLGDAYASRVRIYATDNEDDAISRTRAGQYEREALINVPASRLEHYFQPLASGRFRISEPLRSTVFCGRHNLIQNPPLSRLDLVCCPRAPPASDWATYKLMVEKFGWALRPLGVLFLGRPAPELPLSAPFAPIEPQHPVFIRRSRSSVSASPGSAATAEAAASQAMDSLPGVSAAEEEAAPFGKPDVQALTGQRMDRQLELLEELRSTNEELETTLEALQLTSEEQMAACEELQERQRQLDALARYQHMVLSALDQGLIALDRRFNVTSWNRASEQLFGLKESEVMGREFFGLDIGLPMEDLLTPVNALLSGASHTEVRQLDATSRRGRELRCNVKLRPLSDSASRVLGVLIIISDIGSDPGARRKSSPVRAARRRIRQEEGR